ncbi:MAG: hypothetical protein AAGA73_00885 [Pseudomonadota bacterium]
MGSPGGGVDSSGNSGGPGGSGGNDNDRGNGPSGNDRDSGSDNDRPGRSDRDSSSDQHGMTGSERTEAAFNDAVSQAAGGPDPDDDDKDGQTDAERGALSSDEGQHANEFEGLGPSGGPVDNSPTEDEGQHANEFEGLGPSGGPIDNNLPGDESRNSHRGYGPDDSLAGSIDADVNAGLEAVEPDATDLVGPAGYGGAGLQGGLQAYGQHVDRGVRAAAAGTLTNGPAGSLPAQGYANRTDLARAITDPKMTAAKALDVTPYGPNAQSTQQLSAGAKTASTFNNFAKGAGLGIQPAAGAIQGVMSTPEDASWTDYATNAVVGAIKEADDTAISYGVGWGTTVATAPALGPGSVVAGTGAAVAAGQGWERSSWDQGFDNFVENNVRPGVEVTFEAIDDAGDFIGEKVSDIRDSLFGDDEDNDQR